MFPDLLNAHKKQLDASLASALVITWAFADTAGLESQSLDGIYIASCTPQQQFCWDHRHVCCQRIKWQMLAKWCNRRLKRCSLAQVMTTYSILCSKKFWMKPLWICLPMLPWINKECFKQVAKVFRSANVSHHQEAKQMHLWLCICETIACAAPACCCKNYAGQGSYELYRPYSAWHTGSMVDPATNPQIVTK